LLLLLLLLLRADNVHARRPVVPTVSARSRLIAF
jgi:hypothetical protein